MINKKKFKEEIKLYLRAELVKKFHESGRYGEGKFSGRTNKWKPYKKLIRNTENQNV